MKSEHYQGANEGIVADSVFTYEFDFASSDKGGVPAARPTSGFGMKVVRAILAHTLEESYLSNKGDDPRTDQL